MKPHPPRPKVPRFRVCPICSTNKGKVMSRKQYQAWRKTWPNPTQPAFSDVCNTCKELMKDSVVLCCIGKSKSGHPCDSITMVNVDVFKKKGITDIKVGEAYDVYSCPQCSDRFRFAPQETK